MKVPPIHNMVIQWRKNQPIFFNIFENGGAYINIADPYNILPYVVDYDSYYVGILERKPYLYIPVKASTFDELKLEHPELFL